MFLNLSIKTKEYYSVPLSQIPFEVFTPEGWKQGLFLKYLLTDSDYMSNINTTKLVINSDCIKTILPFDNSIALNCYPHNKHLIGTGAIVTMKSGSELFVANTLEDLSMKLNAV